MSTEIVLAVGFTIMGFSWSLLAVATKWQEKKLHPNVLSTPYSQESNNREQ